MNGSCDVAVIGAGPAGAIAARQLGLAGARVVLIDKASFPREKVCGCCLSPAAVAALERVGLGGLARGLGAAPLDAINLAWLGARVGVRIGGLAVSRAALDMALAREAGAAGVEFLPRTVGSVDEHGELTVRTAGGAGARRVEAKVILVADGLAGSSLARVPRLAARARAGSRIGVAAIVSSGAAGYGAGAIHMAVGAGGYVGAVRLEDVRLNIAAAFDPAMIREHGGPGAAVAAILEGARLGPICEIGTARFHATPGLTRARRVLEWGRVMILGDAAGYIEPFTGEGIAWALAAGIAVVPAALARIAGVEPRERWSETHRRVVASRQWVCRAVAAGLRRPALAGAAFRLLTMVPALARPFVRRIGAPMAEGAA